MRRKRQDDCTLSTLPGQHGAQCPQITWQSDHCGFSFVVDCMPLVDVINRHAPLKASNLEPLFDRMTSNIFNMLQQGWCLPSPVADPVVCHRMCFKKIADHLVNHTMDIGQSCVQAFEPSVPEAFPSSASFICYSDGGTSCDSCSSIGWYIEAVVNTPDSITFSCRHGRQVCQQTSFVLFAGGVSA